MPGNCTSAPYTARPVTLSTPSCRTGRFPITLYCGFVSVVLMLLRLLQPSLSVQDRADNLVVASAAAEIAGAPVTDLSFCGPRFLIQQSLGCNDETRRANSALKRCILQKC